MVSWTLLVKVMSVLKKDWECPQKCCNHGVLYICIDILSGFLSLWCRMCLSVSIFKLFHVYGVINCLLSKVILYFLKDLVCSVEVTVYLNDSLKLCWQSHIWFLTPERASHGPLLQFTHLINGLAPSSIGCECHELAM